MERVLLQPANSLLQPAKKVSSAPLTRPWCKLCLLLSSCSLISETFYNIVLWCTKIFYTLGKGLFIFHHGRTINMFVLEWDIFPAIWLLIPGKQNINKGCNLSSEVIQIHPTIKSFIYITAPSLKLDLILESCLTSPWTCWANFINPNIGWGIDYACNFFRLIFLNGKKGLEVLNFLIPPNSLVNF